MLRGRLEVEDELEGLDPIGDDGTGAADLSIDESWIGVHEIFLAAQRAGFQRIEALWLTGCMVKGVPLPEWLLEHMNGEEE